MVTINIPKEGTIHGPHIYVAPQKQTKEAYFRFVRKFQKQLLEMAQREISLTCFQFHLYTQPC